MGLTENYSRVRQVTNALSANGSTPMAEGLVYALKELAENGRFLKIGRVILKPRLILMTDGKEKKGKKKGINLFYLIRGS